MLPPPVLTLDILALNKVIITSFKETSPPEVSHTRISGFKSKKVIYLSCTAAETVQAVPLGRDPGKRNSWAIEPLQSEFPNTYVAVHTNNIRVWGLPVAHQVSSLPLGGLFCYHILSLRLCFLLIVGTSLSSSSSHLLGPSFREVDRSSKVQHICMTVHSLQPKASADLVTSDKQLTSDSVSPISNIP